MTPLITVFAAVISTVIWYMSKNARKLKIGVLCCSFWGASVMWFVDAVFEYAEMGAEYFSPPALDMLNDIFLGLSVTALALIVWLAALFIKDPYRVLKYEILNKQ